MRSGRLDSRRGPELVARRVYAVVGWPLARPADTATPGREEGCYVTASDWLAEARGVRMEPSDGSAILRGHPGRR